MNTLRTLLTITLSTLLLNACVTEPAALPKELRHSSVVSTSTQTFNPQPGTRLRWKSELKVNAPADTTEIDDSRTQFIKDQLEQQLQGKGYVMVGTGQHADFLLQGLIVLGNDLNEKQLRDLLGFEPGLVAQGTSYEKGSLLLILLNPVSLDTEWRSIVQIFTAPELPQEVQAERIRFGITSLLRPLPDLAH